MRTSSLGRYASWASATVALLAGCGMPGAQPGFGPQASLSERDASWIAPEAQNQDLLYVANAFGVSVYAYPGGKFEGRLTGFLASSGECVDAKGDVFVTSEAGGTIVEYAHGGTTPIATLPAAAEHPLGCAVDPTTGNLAVTTFGSGGSSSGGNLAIYPHAKGTPTTYTDPNILRYYLCGYDDKGNLYVDGVSPGRGSFKLAELPTGSGTFSDIGLNQNISLPGGVQWDGKYLSVADQNNSVIYQFKLRGDAGTAVHATPLGSPAFDVFQFYIDGKTVIAPNDYSAGSKTESDVLYYRYPAGGLPMRTITNVVHHARGVVVSKEKT